MTTLVTGAAGFIGFHLCQKLLEALPQTKVVGIDNLNEYYDPKLKMARLEILSRYENFHFKKIDLCDQASLGALFTDYQIDHVVNLAAQAGVRYAFSHPETYIQSNLVGFSVLLDLARQNKVKHFVFASSSSVYGANLKQPFSESDPTEHPLSLYAATKKSNEMLAHSYASLYDLPCTGLRFFTVYGPWGRPDMALFKFTKAILSGDPIEVYHYGKMSRDFTYIHDIVNATNIILNQPPQKNTSGEFDSGTSHAPYRIVNVGNHHAIPLLDFIAAIEKATGKVAKKTLLPLQAGDVISTYAAIDKLQNTFGYTPRVSIEDGVARFVAWYRSFYG